MEFSIISDVSMGPDLSLPASQEIVDGTELENIMNNNDREEKS